MIKKCLLGLLLAFVSVFAMCTKSEAAFEFKPVAFVVIDYSQNAVYEDLLSWREQVRQAYHVPYYEIIKTSEPTDAAMKVIRERGLSTSKLDKQTLQRIAANIPAKVVVILGINRMEESLVPSWVSIGTMKEIFCGKLLFQPICIFIKRKMTKCS